MLKSDKSTMALSLWESNIGFLTGLMFCGAIAGLRKNSYLINYLSPQRQAELKAFQAHFQQKALHEWVTPIYENALTHARMLRRNLYHLHETSHNYNPPNHHKVIWHEGCTKVIDLGVIYNCSSKAPYVLIVPSLLNRGTIFDLGSPSSFSSYLVQQGFRPLVIEWGEPGDLEKNFTLQCYIKRLNTLTGVLKNQVLKNTTSSLIVLGYCMGGLLLLASKAHSFVKGMGLMAVPWNFSAMPQFPSSFHQFFLKYIMAEQNPVPSSLIQHYFQLLSWPSISKKLQNWGQANDTMKQNMIPLEQWLNEGYSLSQKVVMHCLQWYNNHNPSQSHVIDQKKIYFDSITCPVWACMPLKDKIVPPSASYSLYEQFKHITLHKPDVGHLGLFGSTQAKSKVWEPFTEWAKTIN